MGTNIKPLNGLYSLEDLIVGIDYNKKTSIKETYSYKQYLNYIYYKNDNKYDLDGVKEIGLHDAQINHFFIKSIKNENNELTKKIIGIMGGHSVSRNDQEYWDVAELSRYLTLKGFTIMTGGGPGIMEAGHFGAYFAYLSNEEWRLKVKEFKDILTKYNAFNIPKSFNFNTEEEYFDALFNWFIAAIEIKNSYKGHIGESIAVSTWEYGEEPVMPFATSYAAYFQNSIRESALVRIATYGIIYAKGGGGTLRELFQDVEENAKANSTNPFTPMIFFDKNNFWQSKYGVILPIQEFFRDKLKFSYKGNPHFFETEINGKKFLSTTDTSEDNFKNIVKVFDNPENSEIIHFAFNEYIKNVSF